MNALVRISKPVTNWVAERAHARLPDALEDRSSLADAPFNVLLYMTPWSMQVDAEGRCWINMSATAHEDPGGTVSMGVKKTDRGIVVYPSRGNTWKRSDRMGESVVGFKDYAPVSEVIA